MRHVWMIAATALAVAGCGDKEEKLAAADANAVAANFSPPTVMSRLDFGGMVERRFRRLDRNHDEKITDEELPSEDSRLMMLDRNGDKSVSAIEWSEGMMSRFDAADLNRDGTVTSDERDRARARRAEQAGTGR